MRRPQAPGGFCAMLRSFCSHAQSLPGPEQKHKGQGALLFLCDWPLDFLVNISHMGDFMGGSQSQSKRSLFLIPTCVP